MTITYQGAYLAIHSHPIHTEFVEMGDEVLVVPLTENEEVLLTIELSAAFDGPTTILPGGEAEQDEDYSKTAWRELQEEAGYIPQRLDFLGELLPFSKYLTTRSFVYLARDLIASQLEGDEGYAIEVERVPLSAFETLIETGRLLDARVIAALYMTRAFLKREAEERGQQNG